MSAIDYSGCTEMVRRIATIAEVEESLAFADSLLTSAYDGAYIARIQFKGRVTEEESAGARAIWTLEVGGEFDVMIGGDSVLIRERARIGCRHAFNNDQEMRFELLAGDTWVLTQIEASPRGI